MNDVLAWDGLPPLAIVPTDTTAAIRNNDLVGAEEIEQYEELLDVIKASFHSGKAYNMNFKAWCNSGGWKNTLIKTTRKNRKALCLDRDEVDTFEYGNQHIVL
eukprot:6074994-Ditylum_brightwellii.AAC.1